VRPRMMQRFAGRVLEALGGHEAGFVRGRGRLVHLLPPVVVGMESSVVTPRDGEGQHGGGALLRRRDARLGEGLPGCSRGFAAGHGGTPSGGGGRGRGQGGGGGGAAQLNSKISNARRIQDILELVTGGVELDFIHVANAMNKLVRVATRGPVEPSWKLEGNRLGRDPRFAQLIDLVRAQCLSFRAREGANVLHALGVLHADLGAAAVDDELAAQLGEFVERKARDMNPQEVANTLNALSKLGKAAAAVSPTGWAGLAAAAERTASEMKPQGVANTLNALSKLEAAAAVSPAGWAGLAEAAGRTASEMKPQEIANTLNALSKLEAVAAAVSATGWAGLAEAAQRTASEMKPQEVANTLNALSKLEAAAAAVSLSGWAGLAEAVERTASQMNDQNVANSLYALGALPAAVAELSPSAQKELEAAAEREAANMTSEGCWMTLRGCAKLKLKTPFALSE